MPAECWPFKVTVGVFKWGETLARVFTMVSRSVPKFDHRPKAPSLFLAPMRLPLRLFVERQAAAVRSWTASRKVGGCVGDKAPPESFGVLASTPEAL